MYADISRACILSYFTVSKKECFIFSIINYYLFYRVMMPWQTCTQESPYSLVTRDRGFWRGTENI